MNSGEIDRLPVNQLMQRYNLARSAVYTRMEALGIQPTRIGNKAYVSAQQLQLLDDLHQFIKSGGTTAEFLDQRGMSRPKAEAFDSSSGLSTVQPGLVQLVSEIAAQVASRFQPALPESDPFAYYETLEQAAQNGWLLRTSEIAELLDLPISEFQYYGERFSEAGFVFTRAGFRAGGEVAWRVSKA
ncbi:MAG: hypothetical protein IGS50_19240 [Synechococcales cyanobacterium C42_A2020_086]|jgi:hypothetical protein|nr:hypothetical protein [Synechococcales cyanobacterium M58_A2018_015]MBF2075875.1 hypothetical protein [Synechococcales cyanobacterium C42_A2020_086]